MIHSIIKVSKKERDLLLSIRDLGYGEIFGIEIPDENPEFDFAVTKAELDLITMIRNGMGYIDVLTVHNGEPAISENDFKDRGFRCRKKIKYPTSPKEG